MFQLPRGEYFLLPLISPHRARSPASFAFHGNVSEGKILICINVHVHATLFILTFPEYPGVKSINSFRSHESGLREWFSPWKPPSCGECVDSGITNPQVVVLQPSFFAPHGWKSPFSFRPAASTYE